MQLINFWPPALRLTEWWMETCCWLCTGQQHTETYKGLMNLRCKTDYANLILCRWQRILLSKWEWGVMGGGQSGAEELGFMSFLLSITSHFFNLTGHCLSLVFDLQCFGFDLQLFSAMKKWILCSMFFVSLSISSDSPRVLHLCHCSCSLCNAT